MRPVMWQRLSRCCYTCKLHSDGVHSVGCNRCWRCSASKNAGKTGWVVSCEVADWLTGLPTYRRCRGPGRGIFRWRGKFRTIILFINHSETNSLFLKCLSSVWTYSVYIPSENCLVGRAETLNCVSSWVVDSSTLAQWVCAAAPVKITVFSAFPVIKRQLCRLVLARTQMQLKLHRKLQLFILLRTEASLPFL